MRCRTASWTDGSGGPADDPGRQVVDTSAERPEPAPERVERLLEGAAAEPGAPAEARLAAVVRALTDPAARRPGDPLREEAALAAFRAARAAAGARACTRGPGRARPGWSARAVLGSLAAMCAFGLLTVVTCAGALPTPFRDGVVHSGPPTPVPDDGRPATGTGRTDTPGPDGGARRRTPEHATPSFPAPATKTATARPTADQRTPYGRCAPAVRRGAAPGVRRTGQPRGTERPRRGGRPRRAATGPVERAAARPHRPHRGSAAAAPGPAPERRGRVSGGSVPTGTRMPPTM
ncbi:hypothetical protein [Actinacidiphila sp. ITFR-21]|uniref:hypothetical protein n=1 Tax=Actinacidiphila sp. ITFR-21 TaxID=3075199 RepID=UPI00288B6FFC|nr:hypothetical protein [Streptomyces sp. ITFR-21]WNI19046.1 hypothetical protein RLT57_28285 [Streptomyces sp. ITFR-21]